MTTTVEITAADIAAFASFRERVLRATAASGSRKRGDGRMSLSLPGRYEHVPRWRRVVLTCDTTLSPNYFEIWFAPTLREVLRRANEDLDLLGVR